MKQNHKPRLKKSLNKAKIFTLIFGAFFHLSANAQEVGSAPSLNHSSVDVRACSSYTLPRLDAGNYFTGPGGTGTKMRAGDVLTHTQTVYVYKAGKKKLKYSEGSFTVTIDTMPVINFFLHGSRRNPGQVRLQATPDTGTIKWYDMAAGGTSLGTGTGFMTPSVAKNTVFYAEAVNGACVSDRTELLAIISPVTNLSSSHCGKNLSDLNERILCEPVKGASRYRFEVAHEGNKQVIIGVGGYFSMKQCKDVKMNAWYNIRVAAEVNGAWGDYGPICNITTPSGLIVEETALDLHGNSLIGFSLEAYPNPNTGNFLLVSSHEGEFEIYGENGKLLKTVSITKENGFVIQVEGLKSGEYFVVGDVQDNMVMSKVMVIK
jgi:hypothetical protein